jgi:ribose/xylose/arabinose/galactoside ABC-type transport system permease subunit
MTFAITSGGFDLSVGSTVSIVTSVVALSTNFFYNMMPGMAPGIRMIVVISIVILVSIVLGVINGVIITKLKIQTFIATLATMVIFRGIALIITKGRNISMLKFREYKMFSAGWAPAIIVLVVYILAYLLYKYSRFGVNTRAIGSNESAARISGLSVDRTIILVFVLTSVTAAMSGLLMTSQLLMGSAKLATGFELNVIAPTILGGTALAGGRGNVLGTLAAAILLALISNGLNLLGIADSFQDLIYGIILVFALALGGLRQLSLKKQVRR